MKGPLTWGTLASRSTIAVGGLWLLLCTFFSECKKDDNGPSTYHLTAVDDLTGEALPNTKVVLETVNGGSHQFDTIGATNESGVFEYVFTGEPASGSQYYHQWSLQFVRSDYYNGHAGLSQDHQDHEVTVGMVKKAVIRFTATRIGPETGIYFGFANGFDQFMWYAFGDMDLGEVRTHYQSVPSNRTTEVKWEPWTNSDSVTTVVVPCGHGDTSVVAIDF